MVQKKKSAIWVIFGHGACILFICQTALQSTSAKAIWLMGKYIRMHWCKMALMVRMSTCPASIRYRLHGLCVQTNGYYCMERALLRRKRCVPKKNILLERKLLVA
ncbi:hypothetical protein BJV82DRAFT_613156, partial [Fennellomyces sp. T-0311]